MSGLFPSSLWVGTTSVEPALVPRLDRNRPGKLARMCQQMSPTLDLQCVVPQVKKSTMSRSVAGTVSAKPSLLCPRMAQTPG